MPKVDPRARSLIRIGAPPTALQRLEWHQRLEEDFFLRVFETHANSEEPHIFAPAQIGFAKQSMKDFFCRSGAEAFLRRPREI